MTSPFEPAPGWTVGVDPGMSGAIAIVRERGELVRIHDMPCVTKEGIDPYLVAALEDWRSDPFGQVVIERVHSMPKQGVASTFKFGDGYGVVRGVFAACGRPIEYVSPGTWKRDLRLTSDKGACRQRAIATWPEHRMLFARARDDGRAEAALIALWWVRRDQRGIAA